METTVIVGAGPAGLALAWHLQRRGASYRIVDASEMIAAPWRRRHPQLRLNTLRIFSHQPGMRIPRSCGRWVSRDDYVAYLEEYCRRFAIPVELGTSVSGVVRGSDAWRLETGRGPIDTRNVVIATGGFRVQHMPSIPGLYAFTGTVRHAEDFGDASQYDGRRVLIIGGANSGFDLASCLVRRRVASLAMSVRTPPSVVPRTALGIPTHLLSVLGRHMPRRMQDATLGAITRLFLPELRRLGIAPTPEGAFTRHARDMVTVAVDDGFVAAVASGDAGIIEEIAHVESNRAITRDGTAIEIDDIICATGYRAGLESLVGHLGVLDRYGLPTTNGAEPNPMAPGLWFLGLRGFIWGNMHEQRRIARELARAIVDDHTRRPHSIQ